MDDEVLIFLVDDDREDQDIFIEALSNITEAVDLRVFDSADELLETLTADGRKPDMLFLDLYMPGTDGEQCLLDIRQNSKFDDIPVVIYSTELDIDRIESLFHIGANRYIRKPDSFKSLVLSLEAAVRSLKRNPLGGIAIVNIIA